MNIPFNEETVLTHAHGDGRILVDAIVFYSIPLISKLPQIKIIETNLKAVMVRDSIFPIIYFRSFEAFRKIKELFLAGNKIKMIENKSFTKLKGLKILDLSENQISFITKNMFSGPSKLQEINLENNRINFIEKSAFFFKPNLGKIFINLRKNFCCNLMMVTILF